MPDPLESDGPLVAAVLAGQTDRFEDIVRRYQPALSRLAFSRLGRPDWAEDVVQETFLCAFKSLSTYDSRYSFRTWLWTILLNQCRRQLKRCARQPLVGNLSDHATEAGDALPSPADRESSPVVMLLASERAEQLERLLERLPEVQADALRLRFFGGLKFQEIADAMACSLSSAKARVRRGLLQLGEWLSESTVAAPKNGQPLSETERDCPSGSGELNH